MRRALPVLSARPWAAAVAIGLLGVLAVACSGASEADPTPRPAPPTLAPTFETSAGLPLERFTYVAALTLSEDPGSSDGDGDSITISTQGIVEAPDRHALAYTIRTDTGEFTRKAVLIGRKAWYQPDGRDWRVTVREDPLVDDLLDVAFSAADTGLLSGPAFDQVLDSIRRLPSKEEAVNGVPSRHYAVLSAGTEFFEAFLGRDGRFQQAEDRTWDLWLAADGGWPVRLLASGTVTEEQRVLADLDIAPPATWELKIDISRPDDPTLRVVAPEPG